MSQRDLTSKELGSYEETFQTHMRSYRVDSYDVVVVGSGSSGGALAGRLTQISDKRVLVLEGGPVYESVERMPAELLEASMLSAAMPGNPNNWAYPVESTAGRTHSFPRGKVLGGSSSINGCYFIRGTRQDFSDWSSAGNDEWSYEKVLPVFKRLESDRDFSGQYHGSDGPIPVSRESADRAPEFVDAFHDACHGLGFPDDPDKNAPGSGGVGPLPMNIRDGRRVGTAVGCLIPAMGRPNFTIVGNAVVQRVIFEGRKAVGVEALVDGKPQTFRGEEIVISAGALRTPHILLVSGVGPASQLARFGITVVQDLPGVGQNLTDHPAVQAAWDGDVDLRQLPHRAHITSLLHWQGEGSPMEITPVVVRTGDRVNASGDPGRPAQAVTWQARMLRHALLAIVAFTEESRGTVTLKSADPQVFPVISFNLLSEEADRARCREAVRVANELFQSQSIRQIGGKIVGLDASDLKDDASLDQWVAARIAGGHPSCTCKMGPSSDRMAVVDQHLRVYGVEGLRVADTSVFPVMTTRGPNATAMMVGDRLADFLA
jgi:choline dehydrogenase